MIEKLLDGKRIYVVEDDAMNLAINAVTLKRSGAFVIQDFWNTGAVERLRDYLPIDVVLLDLMLRHDMNGYKIFDELKADPVLAGIPVVAVSAADPDIEIPKAKVKGFAGFIGKPIKPILFPQQIADILDGKQIWYARNDHMEV